MVQFPTEHWQQRITTFISLIQEERTWKTKLDETLKLTQPFPHLYDATNRMMEILSDPNKYQAETDRMLSLGLKGAVTPPPETHPNIFPFQQILARYLPTCLNFYYQLDPPSTDEKRGYFLVVYFNLRHPMSSEKLDLPFIVPALIRGSPITPELKDKYPPFAVLRGETTRCWPLTIINGRLTTTIPLNPNNADTPTIERLLKTLQTNPPSTPPLPMAIVGTGKDKFDSELNFRIHL